MGYDEGLMSQLKNPVVIDYLRRNHQVSHTWLIENALRKKLGMEQRPYSQCNRGRTNPAEDRRKLLPIKVLDPQLVNHIITQRKVYGISHRYTIESAVLAMILEQGRRKRK